MDAKKHSLAVVCCALAMGIGHLAFAADEPAGARTDARGVVDNELGLERSVEESIAFSGTGTFDLLDNGIVVLQTGGQLLIAPETTEIRIIDTETVVFRLVDAGLSLVNYDGKKFVDKDGRKTRDLEPTQFATTRIDTTDRGQLNRYSILSLEGQISVGFDEDGGIEISVRDAGRELFSLAVSEADGVPSGELGDLQSDSANFGSSCSATCTGGSCSITCPLSKAAVCFCRGRIPVCVCTDKPKEVSIDTTDEG